MTRLPAARLAAVALLVSGLVWPARAQPAAATGPATAQTAPQAAVQPAADRFAAVAALLEEARARLGSPGLSAAVVENDELTWSAGFGLADVEHDVPARATTVYRIASISKPIAATAIMQLVEQGRVRLDDPIQNYVRVFPRKGEATITLRHLLTHTSGIRHYKPGEMESLQSYDSIESAIAIFKDDPLLFTPGARYSYSSYAYNLLAGVVEKASGLTYEAYLREHVFEPAGMRQTRLERPQDIVKGRARQYVRAGGGNGAVRNAPYADLSVKWAGGGVISTAEDLARFHIALDQERLLTRASMDQMYAPPKLRNGELSTYGLGWMLQTDAEKRLWVAHSGGATGGTTYLLRLPEAGLAVVLLSNVESAPDLKGLAERAASLVLGGRPFETPGRQE
jgi:CubicO group peptidase (beta-lactamase class C family)